MKCFMLAFLNFILLFSTAKSQVNIDYSNEGVLSSACNTFSSTPIVDGYTHQSTIGFPTYLAAPQNLISLACSATQSGSTIEYRGTEYQILFPFKKYFSYEITSYFKGVKVQADAFFPRLGMAVLKTPKNANVALNCVGPQLFDPTQYSSIESYSVLTNPSGPILTTGWLGDNYQSLLIAALPTQGSVTTGATNIQIRKVTITEKSPFSISPTAKTIVCGIPITQTFTVNNLAGVPGITQYVWNLGPLPTGWKYNGTSAPVSITTTTNSLTLSTNANASLGPQNVSVTVYQGANPINAGSSIITFDQSIPSTIFMTGNLELFTSDPIVGSYSINGLGSGHTVTWQQPNPNTLGSLSFSGSSATFTPNINATGTVILAASISNPCGNSATRNLTIALKNGCSELLPPSNLNAEPTINGTTKLIWQNRSPATYVVQVSSSTPGGPNFSSTASSSFYNLFSATAITGQFRVQSLCTGGSSAWSSWQTFSASAVPSSCSLVPSINLIAANSCGGGSYLCGYAKYMFDLVSGSAGYEIESVVFNVGLGQTRPVQTFTATTSPAYNSYGHDLTGTGWSIRFRIRTKCGSGSYGAFSPWSANFSLN
jgi:hypothetical protein